MKKLYYFNRKQIYLMNAENFTNKWKANLGRGLMIGFMGLMLVLLSNNTLSSQCPLVCNDNVQISLDDDCQVEVTPDMILEGQGSASCDYNVVVKDLNGVTIAGSPFVDGHWVGKTLQVGVYVGFDPNANNCWGYIHIEDKLKPSVVCPDTSYVSCYDAPSVWPKPAGIDNCGSPVTVTELSDELENLDCNSEYSAKRTIVYRAEDASGNISDLCYRVIYYTRVHLSDVEWPVNYDQPNPPGNTNGVDEPMLLCSTNFGSPSWDTNGNYYPDPSETGAPYDSLSGADIYPNNILCELNVVFGDEVLDICPNSYKVLRQWTVMDWCTGDIEQRFQIIKVVDNEGPIVTAVPDDLIAYVHPYTCLASFDVPAPIVIFDCGETTYTVEYKIGDGLTMPGPGVVFTSNGVTGNYIDGYTIHNLPPTLNPDSVNVWIRYTVSDECGNKTQAFTEIKVIDNVPPVAVCDQFTVVTLTNTGVAYVEALSFDDGSHDNCTDVTFRVKRMTSGCDNGWNTFKEYVLFCCSDLGNDDLMVILEVSDLNGNTNTCMVNVTVQDKLKPIITCPDDITIDCTDDLYDLGLTGEATAEDNCGNPVITYQDFGSLGNCNTGTITRRWKATDADGLFDQCNQKIYVVNYHPFNGYISWPQNRDLDGCMEVDTDPSNPILGEPSYNDDACSLIAHTYEDQVFTFVDDACFKILRHWTVIDWCIYEETNGQEGIWGPKTQIIKVFDDNAPVLGDCSSKVLCIYEASTTKCGGQVTELIQTADDECSGSDDDLEWGYIVEEDFDGNGIFTFYNDGYSRNANGYYETGDYRIKWTVEDNCGNFSNCTQYFEVKDCKNPTPYCLGEVATVVMNNSGTIEIWASDFDLGSFDNCPGDLLFSFSGTSYQPNKTFDCDDLGLLPVEMWVWDAAGNKDFCQVILNLQDHSNACPGQGALVNISGLVRNEAMEPLAGASVKIEENTDEIPAIVHESDEDGKFVFDNMHKNVDFVITAQGSDDYMNGVATLDLLLMQRHILKLKYLDSPYKVIAADINSDENINAIDLIELRKLILGKIEALPYNESWRFVDAGEEFEDDKKPFPFNEKIILTNVESNTSINNFISVKIGDVNNDASMTMMNSNASANRNSVSFSTENVNFATGELVNVVITAGELQSILGFQGTFNFNQNALTFEKVVSGSLTMTEANVGTRLASRGLVTMSWSNPQMNNITSDESLFTLVFRAKTKGQLSEMFSLNSELTTSEVYDDNYNTNNLNLTFKNIANTQTMSFELFQNEPNPFSDITMIRFVLPNASTASLKVFDVTGKQLLVVSKDFSKGENQFEISNDMLNTSGILYYQLEADQFMSTKKMVLIRK